jgi:hypothetical protein
MIELAVALSAIAAKAIVVELVRGGTFDRNGWADVAGQVVETMVATSARQESGIRELGQKIDDIALREFDQHMTAGRRYMRDLPVEWRTARDRRDLIRDARREFVDAASIAYNRKDLIRQVTAEVAIAGCWLWVPSIKDVTSTIGPARVLLENELLFGTKPVSSPYADVVKLCRSYGEQPAHTGSPVVPSLGIIPIARTGVYVRENRWARCAGVEVRADLRQYWSSREAGAVTVDVRNTRAEWIAAELVRESGTLASRTALIVTLPTDNTLPAENRVAPGDAVTLDLTPSVLPSPWVRRSRWLAAATGESTFTLSVPTPPVATIGFLLPENRTTAQTNQKSSSSSSR